MSRKGSRRTRTDPKMVPKSANDQFVFPVLSFSAPTSGLKGAWRGVPEPNGLQNLFKLYSKSCDKSIRNKYGNQMQHLKPTTDSVAKLLEQMSMFLQGFLPESRSSVDSCKKLLCSAPSRRLLKSRWRFRLQAL